MENSIIENIVTYIIHNTPLLISAASSLVFFVVNIITAIRSKNKSKLKEALLDLPEVINQVELLYNSEVFQGPSCLVKKSMAEELCYKRFGKLYQKNVEMFSTAIEDILSTPQKKGGSSDV